ncbi:MAG: hypothetical protein AAFS12_01450 [Cyanobacteria bacterium J06632_19]
MNQDENYKEQQLQEENNTVEQTDNSLSQSSVEQSRSPVTSVENSLNSVSFPMANSSENTNTEGSILNPESVDNSPEYNLAAQRVAQLQRTEESLKEEISNLQASYITLHVEVGNTQTALS